MTRVGRWLRGLFQEVVAALGITVAEGKQLKASQVCPSEPEAELPCT